MQSGSNQTIIALQQQWSTVFREHGTVLQQFQRGRSMRDLQQDEAIKVQVQLLESLNIIKGKMRSRINLINEVHCKYDKTLGELSAYKKQGVPRLVSFSRQKLGDLDVQIVNLLKFSRLSAKKQNREGENMVRSHSIKQQIRTVKLKTSLIELQFKEMLPAKRQSGNKQ